MNVHNNHNPDAAELIDTPSRRRFFTVGACASLPALATAGPVGALPAAAFLHEDSVSLDGEWAFRIDPSGLGEEKGWHSASGLPDGWRKVHVPHTWQVEAPTAEYMGVAWYRREFEVPAAWGDCAVRLEFEAVFHTATVWVNGKLAGRHDGKGYTAFTFNVRPLLRLGSRNTLAVRADNSFADSMLPRGTSSDWAHDGGIYRPVRLLVTPSSFIERIAVDTDLDLSSGDAVLKVSVVVHNSASSPWQGRLSYRAIDEETGLTALAESAAVSLSLGAGESKTVQLLQAVMHQPKLWHFDHPNLYVLAVSLSNGHAANTTFGVRKIETRDCAFYLNGERVRLMGVERMGGSHPEYGMAEPMRLVEHDKREMKELNCVYTRVHWQQDRRLLDWCDRNGMLIQTEVPTWGPDTFKGMAQHPDAGLMNNGLEQLREMIERDRNHPCIFSWGVCNEVGGQNPAAYEFAKRLYAEAKRLDPRRLVTYASNSLQKTPERDVAGLMDYIMWNEYYETWYGGTTEVEMARNLDEIHRAFPGKAIVISEYGWCSCTTQMKENDEKRIDILRRQDQEFRKRDYIAGLIYFCYNDYRTHIGHEGAGVMKQRGGGVVDVFGARKPSFSQLSAESSPIESIEVTGRAGELRVVVQTRQSVPSYTLRGYSLRSVVYDAGNVPLERYESALPDLPPGKRAEVRVQFSEKDPSRVQLDVMRPTRFVAHTTTWRP